MTSVTIPSCCKTPQWVLERDLGHAYSMDFILGNCLACGKYTVNVFSVATAVTGFEAISDADLLRIKSLPDGREMKEFMKDWSDVNC